MAAFKCKMCGAQLDVKQGETVATCDYCGSRQTVSSGDDERKANLFNRANELRQRCEFDKAMLSYQSIVSLFPHEPEAHWGLALCRYGIEYVEDLGSRKRKPTMHRASFEPILKDSDYLEAIAYADAVAKEQYQDEAKEISDIQGNILSISQKEEPFDVFICYKESDECGKRTPDSVLAQDIYSQLADRGYKVFFSRITLESKIGAMYEPYIFAALNSAKVMLVVGTKREYFDAVWVKNEWSRFLSLMQTKTDKYLIPCYRGMDAYQMPEELLSFQAQDMGKLGFLQDLTRGIDKLMGKNAAPWPSMAQQAVVSDVNVEALVTRAEILIGDGDFSKADSLLEKALDNDPKNSRAYLLKCLEDLGLRSADELKNQPSPLSGNRNFARAHEFGSPEERKELDAINEYIASRNESDRLRGIYDRATTLKKRKSYRQAEEAFRSISGFKDADGQAEDCQKLQNQLEYDAAMSMKEAGSFDEAKRGFLALGDFRDAPAQARDCDAQKKEDIYRKGLVGDIPHAGKSELRSKAESLKAIPGYRNADSLVYQYEKRIEAIAAEEREAAKRRRRRIRLVSAALLSVAAVSIGTALLTTMYIVPLNRQNGIIRAINDGDYAGAQSLLGENGNFGESKRLAAMVSAGVSFDSGDYESGIEHVYDAGGYVYASYDGNGGSAPSSGALAKPGIKKAYVDAKAEKDGYAFHGWVLKDYAMDARNFSASISLEAGYDIITYKISYDLGGGSVRGNPLTYDTEHEETLPTPTREGYTFLGWTGSNGDAPETSVTIAKGTTGNLSYKANWSANAYAVTLNANGGTCSSDSMNIQYNSSYSLPTPTRVGYEFDGWYNGSSKVNQSGTWTHASNATLTAHWDVIAYAITYNLNGGSNPASNPSSYTVEDSVALSNPTKTGYTFTGWTNGSGSQVASIPQGSTGSIALTANWSANKYTVTVVINNDSLGNVSGAGDHDFGSAVTLAATTTSDNVFKGWYSDSSYLTKVSDSNPYSFTLDTEGLTLYAKFFTKAEEEAWNIAHGVTPVYDSGAGTITYGLYPQTVVSDSSLIASLNALGGDAVNATSGYYFHDNEYYYPLTANPNESGYTFSDGSTIAAETKYWFKCEPITWRAFALGDGSYTLLSDKIIDCRRYYGSTDMRTINGNAIYPNNYEYSDIRKWLNGRFYNKAFALDSSSIQATEVNNSASTTDNSSNPYVCSNTNDNVYLFSYRDYLNSSYGFSSSTNRTNTRSAHATDFAKANGAEIQYDASNYWTRSPCSNYYFRVWAVPADGYLFGNSVPASRTGVRPALSLKLS